MSTRPAERRPGKPGEPIRLRIPVSPAPTSDTGPAHACASDEVGSKPAAADIQTPSPLPVRAQPKPSSSGKARPQWLDEIRKLVRESGYQAAGRRLGSGVLSASTQETREKMLIKIFRELDGLGYRLPSVHSLRDRHIQALVAAWESRGLAAASIQNRLTHLRKLSDWIGKGGLVRPALAYASDPERVRVGTVAKYDHAWRAAGIDAAQMVRLVAAYDPHVGIQLKLCQAFMLRRREAVMFRPHIADRQTHIVVEEGTKGGRVRVVEIMSEQQRCVLNEAKAFVRSKTDHVGHSNKTLKQNIAHFAYVLRRFGLTRDQLGVTAHGLRHEGLGDLFEAVAGVPAPIRVDNVREVLAQVAPDRLQDARRKVAEVAGHSRLSISGAYIGGLLGREQLQRAAERRELADFKRMLELRGRSSLTEPERLELNRLQRSLVKTLGYGLVFPVDERAPDTAADADAAPEGGTPGDAPSPASPQDS